MASARSTTDLALQHLQEQVSQQVSCPCSPTPCPPQDLASLFGGDPWPYPGSDIGDWGHFPSFSSMRYGACPMPSSIQCHCGLDGWGLSPLPGPRAKGNRQMRGWVEPPPRHTPSAHSPRSPPDCRASGPGGRREVAAQPLPRGHMQRRAPVPCLWSAPLNSPSKKGTGPSPPTAVPPRWGLQAAKPLPHL